MTITKETNKELSKNAKKDAAAMTFLTRLNMGDSPKDAAQGLCSQKGVTAFITEMMPRVQASFLHTVPQAQARILELLHGKKQVVDKFGEIKTLDDGDLSLKAAETLLKYAGLGAKEVIVNTSKPKEMTLMDALIAEDVDINTNDTE